MHSEFCDLLLSFTRLALIFLIILFVLRFWWKTHTFLPLPPGPFSIPFLGFLPFVGKDFHLTLTELAKSYGSVYQIFLGSRRVVIINDFRLVREAFRKPIFSGRPDTEVTKILQGYGIVHSDGDLWNEQRSFLHKVLRQIGVKQIMQNNNAIEHKINIQVKEFLNNLETFERKSCRIRPFIACAVSNVIGSLLISLTLKNEEDENFRKLLELIDEGFKHVTVAMPVNFIPILRYIPIVNSAVQKIKQNREQTGEYFKNLVENHKKTLDPSNLRDICDAYLVQQEKVQNNGKKSYFSEEQLIQVMNDMFSAGMETVTSTLEWAILFLMLNPEAQKNIQKEIENIVGDDRLPTLADMANMPYTEATIYEVLRRSNVIAIGIAHLTLQDTILAGFRIPKNSQVLPNFYAIHMDPNLWVNPNVFEPRRFIKDGKIFKPNFFMPFSVGRRMCLGDTLARMEVFLFLTRLLKKYNLSIPLNEEIPSTVGITAATTVPMPYNVCLTRRK